MSTKLFIQALGLLLPISCLAMSDVRGIGQTVDMESYVRATFQNTIEAPKERPTLRFGADGKFKVVQFADTHYVPGNPASAAAIERINEVLDAELPDLVIFTGDIVYGRPAAEGLKACLEPVVSRKIPFAVTLGNHDDEQDMSRAEIFEFVRNVPGNLTSTTAGISGVTNYLLTVGASSGSADAFAMWIFDSHSYSKELLTRGYDWIKADQIAWYRRESSALTTQNGGQPLPALAFFHIPLPEFNLAAADENSPLVGIRGEKSCSPAINSGLFTAMYEQRDVMGVFVGHDHVNDYVTAWKGIVLGYGRFTGGETVYHDIPGANGARVFELTEGQRSFRTWIRLAGGRVISPIDIPGDFTKTE